MTNSAALVSKRELGFRASTETYLEPYLTKSAFLQTATSQVSDLPYPTSTFSSTLAVDMCL